MSGQSSPMRKHVLDGHFPPDFLVEQLEFRDEILYLRRPPNPLPALLCQSFIGDQETDGEG